MRKIFLASLVIILLISFTKIVLAEKKYVRQELISFTWGDGEYQLGSDYDQFYDSEGNYIGPEDAGSENIGPGPIKINNKGEIYIQDCVNRRILKYDSNGFFLKSNEMFFGLSDAMAFDEKDNFYIILMGAIIEKYSPDFKKRHIMQYDGSKTTFPPKRMVIDDSEDKIYILDDEFVTEIEFKEQPIEKEISGRKIKFQPTKVLKKKIIEELQRGDKNVRIKINSLKSNQQRIIDLKSEKYIGWGITEWIGESGGNIFLRTSGREDPYTLKEKEIVNLYNDSGKLLSEIILDKDERLFFNQKYIIDIDNEGNIYHLWIQKDGAKLIKWGK